MVRPDSLRQVTRNFADSDIGCVVGRVTYVNEADTSVSEGEGL